MAKISYHDTDDVNTILHIVTQVATQEIKKEVAPWLKNMYFTGATLCVDMYSNNELDVMTFCHSDETVGFFSGGPRKLLSIESCKMLENLMVLSNIKHNKKWLIN